MPILLLSDIFVQLYENIFLFIKFNNDCYCYCLLLLISNQSCFCPIDLPTSVLLTQKYILSVDIGVTPLYVCIHVYVCVCFESSYVYPFLPHLQWGTTDIEIKFAAA